MPTPLIDCPHVTVPIHERHAPEVRALLVEMASQVKALEFEPEAGSLRATIEARGLATAARWALKGERDAE